MILREDRNKMRNKIFVKTTCGFAPKVCFAPKTDITISLLWDQYTRKKI
jgi:hypothetical protein